MSSQSVFVNILCSNGFLNPREQKETELRTKLNQLAQEVRHKDEKIKQHEKTLLKLDSVRYYIHLIMIREL